MADEAAATFLGVPIVREHRLQYQGSTKPVLVPAQDISNTTLSSPVFFRRRFTYQSIAACVFPFAAAATVAVTTTFSNVTYAGTFIYQSVAPVVFVAPEVVTLDKWYAPWREPVRTRSGLKASAQQASVLPPPEIIPSDKWYAPWREPVRPKRGLRADLQQFYTADTQPVPTSKGMGWFAPLAEPYPYKRGLKAQYQQFLAIDPRWIPDPSKFLSGWFNWLSEPKRFPVGIKAWLQSSSAQTLIPGSLFPAVTITISATETNNDSFTGAIVVATTPFPTIEPRALVSIVEVPVPSNNSPTSIIET